VEILEMNDKRRYQRHAVNNKDDKNTKGEVTVEKELLKIVDFSSSGMCLLSKTFISVDEAVSISVDFEDHGKIDLIGKVVRVKRQKGKWHVAIDLTETYKRDTLKKV
jgi:hypothetical protein